MSCKSFVIGRSSGMKGKSFKELRNSIVGLMLSKYKLRTLRASWMCAMRDLQIVVQTNGE